MKEVRDEHVRGGTGLSKRAEASEGIGAGGSVRSRPLRAFAVLPHTVHGCHEWP